MMFLMMIAEVWDPVDEAIERSLLESAQTGAQGDRTILRDRLRTQTEWAAIIDNAIRGTNRRDQREILG